MIKRKPNRHKDSQPYKKHGGHRTAPPVDKAKRRKREPLTVITDQTTGRSRVVRKKADG
jgi:hypothetical protein